MSKSLGEEFVGQLFSRNWQVRGQGILALDTEMKNPDRSQLVRDTEPDELSIQVFHAVKIGLMDKIIQVNHDTISLFVATVQGIFKNTRKYNSGLHKL
jgi:hypothetical protein